MKKYIYSLFCIKPIQRWSTGSRFFDIIIHLAVLTIFISGCTNWKAKFYQSQIDLKECQQVKIDSSIIMESVTWSSISALPLDIDTFIVLYDTSTGYVIPSFNAKEQHLCSFDSVKAWITIENSIQNQEFIQKIYLDSFQYPLKTIIKTQKIPVRIDQTNYWKPIAIAAIVAAVILIIGFFVQLRRRS